MHTSHANRFPDTHSNLVFFSSLLSSSLLSSLSPLRRQIILESSGSLSPPAIALPKLLCENPEYLPPALPPKRQRANSKTMNNLHTPPSSPKMCLNESIDENAETSSQNLNNNNVHGKSSLASDTLGTSNKSLTPVTPTTPSFATTPTLTQSKSANMPLVSHTTMSENSSMKPPTTMKAPTQPFEPSNHSADADVRTPIYSNDNSRFSDENQYIYLYDGGGGGGGGCGAAFNDKHKPNKNGIDSDTSGGKAKVDSDGAGSNSNTTSTKTINSNSKIKNNINNNNNSNTSDNNEQGEESVVVLRHPSSSMHSQKVRMVCFTFFQLFFSNLFCHSDLNSFSLQFA